MKQCLIGHNTSPGTMNIGSGPTLDELSDAQILKLQKYLAPDCIIYIRACHDADGKEAQQKYKRFARRIRRLVIAYQGLVSPIGTGVPITEDVNSKGEIYFVWYARCKPIIFSPF